MPLNTTHRKAANAPLALIAEALAQTRLANQFRKRHLTRKPEDARPCVDREDGVVAGPEGLARYVASVVAGDEKKVDEREERADRLDEEMVLRIETGARRDRSRIFG